MNNKMIKAIYCNTETYKKNAKKKTQTKQKHNKTMMKGDSQNMIKAYKNVN